MVYAEKDNKCYYALREATTGKKRLIAIKPAEASSYNEKGHGIFFPVQLAPFNKRTIADIKAIRAYALDLDNGTKEELLKLAENSPLRPSLIIETKNGYHLYWILSKEVALNAKSRVVALKDFKVIMENRLIPYFQLRDEQGDTVYRTDYKGNTRVVGADINAKDVARVLRVPGYNHLKDEKDPYKITITEENSFRYTEEELRGAFPYRKTEKQKGTEAVKSSAISNYSLFWKAFSELDCKEGIEILSGTPAVNKDIFTFYKNSNGTEQIYANGVSTSCWIDDSGKIGSHASGGPTLIQWLRYYKHEYGRIAQIGKEHLGLHDNKPSNYRMALLLNLDRKIVYTNSAFYYYSETIHVWEEWKTPEVRRLLHSITLDNGIEPSTNRVSDIFNLAKDHFFKQDALNTKRHILTFNNVALDTATLEVLPFSPEYYSTIKIDYDFDAKAKCPQWLKFLNEVLVDKELQLLAQEMVGYCLTTETKYHVAFFLDGGGRNGKSTFMEIIKSLVGQDNVSNTSFHSLSSRFGLQNMENKLVNYDAEISADKLPNTNMFKAIVGGDPVEVERKFRDSYTTSFFCKLIYAANELPAIRDRSKGFFARLIILPFLNEFTKLKGNLDRLIIFKLKKEMPGILNWAIAGLQRLRDNDEFSSSVRSAKRLESYKVENSSILQYIEEECVFNSEAKTSGKSLFIGYTEFCREAGLKPFSRKKVGLELRKLGTIKFVSIKNLVHYIGIEIQEDDY